MEEESLFDTNFKRIFSLFLRQISGLLLLPVLVVLKLRLRFLLLLIILVIFEFKWFNLLSSFFFFCVNDDFFKFIAEEFSSWWDFGEEIFERDIFSFNFSSGILLCFNFGFNIGFLLEWYGHIHFFCKHHLKSELWTK